MNPTEEQTYREGVKASLDRLEKGMHEGFAGVYRRQDHTNGRVRRHDILIYCTIVALVVFMASNNSAIAEAFAHLLGI